MHDCLAKDRRARIQSASELAVALRAVSSTPTAGAPAPARTSRIAIAIVAALLAGAGALFVAQRRTAPAPAATARAMSLAVLPFTAPADQLYALRDALRHGGEIAFLRQKLALSEAAGETHTTLAAIELQLNDRDAALAHLERAYVDHERDLIYLKTSPTYAELRGEPRFEALLEKSAFPPTNRRRGRRRHFWGGRTAAPE